MIVFLIIIIIIIIIITRAYWARGPVGDPIPMLLGLRTGNWVKENWAKGRIPIRDASLTCIDNYW